MNELQIKLQHKPTNINIFFNYQYLITPFSAVNPGYVEFINVLSALQNKWIEFIKQYTCRHSEICLLYTSPSPRD